MNFKITRIFIVFFTTSCAFSFVIINYFYPLCGVWRHSSPVCTLFFFPKKYFPCIRRVPLVFFFIPLEVSFKELIYVIIQFRFIKCHTSHFSRIPKPPASSYISLSIWDHQCGVQILFRKSMPSNGIGKTDEWGHQMAHNPCRFRLFHREESGRPARLIS